MFSGVWMSVRSGVQSPRPMAISTAHVAALSTIVVETAVFISRYSFAPNSCATMTEHPMLQPKAKAMKMSVIS